MMIYAVSPDPGKVETVRKRIDASGLYGGRISVEAWPLDRVPYADYFANLVVSESAIFGGRSPAAPAEMFRMLKPVGGVALIGRPAAIESGGDVSNDFSVGNALRGVPRRETATALRVPRNATEGVPYRGTNSANAGGATGQEPDD